MESDDPFFNEAQMLRFVHGDIYLQFMYDHMLGKGHNSETALEVLFNANVLGDSGMTIAYESFAEEGDQK
ncbi:hypothetical protein [Paenibacillus sp. FSL H3-0469]|uniref:hypothetical protein n=1 Tax=Paenibacillus sp. FSL H3-0469 TaxID=2954506 RepID=UPI0031017690